MKKGRPRRLDEAAVREIREWYARWAAVERPKQMAIRHGVHRSALLQIALGDIYKDAQS